MAGSLRRSAQRPDLDAQETLAAEAAGGRAPADLDALGLQPLLDLVADVVRAGGAADPHRELLAPEAGDERLGEGAHDRGHAHRGAPVVVIPPHVVARLELARGGALARLDPVDVEEPVDGPAAAAAAGHAVDRLDEAAAVAGVDLEPALELAHDGLAAAQRVRAARPDLARAEVARDRDGRAALLALAGAQAAARRREGGGEHGDEDAGTRHRTRITTRVSARLPALSVAATLMV